MARKPPKDFKVKTVHIEGYMFEGEPVSLLIDKLLIDTQLMMDPIIDRFDMYDDIVITGFVPMTEAEIKQAKKRSEAARASAEKRRLAKEEKELEMLKKLTEKFGDRFGVSKVDP